MEKPTEPLRRVLLVSPLAGDEPGLASSLAEAGFVVIPARNGDQALSYFADSPVDVVLLDVDMPRDDEYVDGSDICEKLQSLPGGTGTPIVMLDPTGDPDTRARAMRAGATDVIAVPFDVRALCYRLNYHARAARAFHDAREHGRRLHTAQRLARLALWELDLTTRRFGWVTTESTVFGLPAERGSGPEALFRWVNDGDRARVEAALAEPCSHRLEFRIATPAGGELTIHQEAEIVLDDLDGSIRMVGVAQDISELRDAERHIRELAYVDSLTGLPNRAFLRTFMGHAVAGARRQKHPLAVLALDLDMFKHVNDTLGHAAGDTLLREVGTRIQSCIRRSDAAAHALAKLEPVDHGDALASRLGGDEFVVVLSHLRNAEDAAVVAQRINQRLAASFEILGHQVNISSSIGIAMFPDNGEDVDALLAQADAAMYHAKEGGRNTFRFFSDAIDARVKERAEVDALLRTALSATTARPPRGEAAELLLYYQPRLALPMKRIVGVEGLPRLRLRDGGMVRPEVFAPIAEATGLSVPLGGWVLGRACALAANRSRPGAPIAIALGVSARQLRDATFVDNVARALEDAQLPARLLELEIVDATAMTGDSLGGKALVELRRLGVRVTLAELASGSFSLASLAHLPIDVLKLDPRLVHALGRDAREEAIAVALIGLCRQLGIHVVAAGVETAAQLAQLAQLGPIDVQGGLLSGPLTERELEAFIASHSRSDGVDEKTSGLPTSPGAPPR